MFKNHGIQTNSGNTNDALVMKIALALQSSNQWRACKIADAAQFNLLLWVASWEFEFRTETGKSYRVVENCPAPAVWRTNVFMDGKLVSDKRAVTQKRAHLQRPQFARVPCAVKENEPFDLLAISLFGAQRTMMKTHDRPRLFPQPGLGIGDQFVFRCGFSNSVYCTPQELNSCGQ